MSAPSGSISLRGGEYVVKPTVRKARISLWRPTRASRSSPSLRLQVFTSCRAVFPSSPAWANRLRIIQAVLHALYRIDVDLARPSSHMSASHVAGLRVQAAMGNSKDSYSLPVPSRKHTFIRSETARPAEREPDAGRIESQSRPVARLTLLRFREMRDRLVFEIECQQPHDSDWLGETLKCDQPARLQIMSRNPSTMSGCPLTIVAIGRDLKTGLNTQPKSVWRGRLLSYRPANKFAAANSIYFPRLSSTIRTPGQSRRFRCMTGSPTPWHRSASSTSPCIGQMIRVKCNGP